MIGGMIAMKIIIFDFMIQRQLYYRTKYEIGIENVINLNIIRFSLKSFTFDV